jgi:hypothetical protein
VVVRGEVVSSAVDASGPTHAVLSAVKTVGHPRGADSAGRGSSHVVGLQTFGAGRSRDVDHTVGTGSVYIRAGKALGTADVGLIGAGEGNGVRGAGHPEGVDS